MYEKSVFFDLMKYSCFQVSKKKKGGAGALISRPMTLPITLKLSSDKSTLSVGLVIQLT